MVKNKASSFYDQLKLVSSFLRCQTIKKLNNPNWIMNGTEKNLCTISQDFYFEADKLTKVQNSNTNENNPRKLNRVKLILISSYRNCLYNTKIISSQKLSWQIFFLGRTSKFTHHLGYNWRHLRVCLMLCKICRVLHNWKLKSTNYCIWK